MCAGGVCLAAGGKYGSSSSGAVRSSRAVPAAEIERAIQLSAGYLRRHNSPSGRFVYRRHTDSRADYDEKTYNLLRHAGTIYALATDYDRSRNEETRGTLRRAAGYLRTFVAPVPNTTNVPAVWSDPERLGENEPDRPACAKLGGTGLGLVALVSAERICPGTVPLAEARALGRFLLFMQTPDGRFFSKYGRDSGIDREWHSLYYPGEAVLGLLMLHDLDPDPEWLDAAIRGMAWLERERRHARNVPADHWALIATAGLIRKYDQVVSPPCTRDLLIRHAEQIVKTILSEQKTDTADAAVRGSFLHDARTTPTSIRLEGLLSALNYLPAEMKGLHARVENACHMGMRFLLLAQIGEGELRGGFPRAVRPVAGDTGAAAAFNRRVGEVRIDYVQHALSAMILYRDRYHPVR